MRIVELLSKIHLPINNEEAEILDMFTEEDKEVLKKDLSERQQILANQLVNKDVLYRLKENGRVKYRKKIK